MSAPWRRGSGAAFELGDRRGQQQAPAPQLLVELGGQRRLSPAAPEPGPTQRADHSQGPQGEEETDKQLQADLQHGATPDVGGQGKMGASLGAGAWSQAWAPLPAGGSSAPEAMAEPLPALSDADLETLHAALDPLLAGFGEGECCLDDASAFLARLGLATTAGADGVASPLMQWLESWRQAGGNRQTLRLMVTTLLAERGPAGAAGSAPGA